MVEVRDQTRGRERTGKQRIGEEFMEGGGLRLKSHWKEAVGRRRKCSRGGLRYYGADTGLGD